MPTDMESAENKPQTPETSAESSESREERRKDRIGSEEDADLQAARLEDLTERGAKNIQAARSGLVDVRQDLELSPLTETPPGIAADKAAVARYEARAAQLRTEKDGSAGAVENAAERPPEAASENNERYSSHLLEKLGLKEGEAAKVDAARDAIRKSDPTGEKLKIFEEALKYYGDEQPAAEIPVFHSTGSYALAKIIEHGALESRRNTVTGEHVNTGEARGTTSLAIGGYASSEVISRAYARMNERRSRLKLDQSDITGTRVAEDIVKTVFDEIPNLKPEEQQQVRNYIADLKKQSGREDSSDEQFMRFKMKDVGERKYYFDLGDAQNQAGDLRRQIAEAKAQDSDWKVQELSGRLAKADERLRSYEAESEEMKQEMSDPFPVSLVYEGKHLPAEDLNSTVGGLIAERRTGQPLNNGELRQINAPLESVGKVRTWLKKRIDDLPADSPERRSLEKVRVVPMEYFEAKRIISG